MSPTVRSERLVLRLPQIGDAPRMTQYLDNFAVAGNLARVPHPYRLTDAENFISSRPQNPAHDDTSFVIDLPGEGLIGMVGFHHRADAAVIGYWLGEPYWNRGFMTEAARTALDWYFADPRPGRVISGVFHFNTASLAIQKKLGFRETGTSSLLCLARGVHVRHIDTELSRAVWAGKRAS